jgi:hypothetical protein
MNFKPGDEVSFINEKRNGIVKKIITQEMVSVEIEDGFDIPVLIKELIIIRPKSVTDNISIENEKNVHVTHYESKPLIEEEAIEDATVFLLNKADTATPKGLYLALVPKNRENITAAGLKLLIVNNTAYDVLFGCYNKPDKDYSAFTYDAFGKYSSYLLTEIAHTALNEWTDLLLHIMFYAESETIRPPLDKSVKINPVKVFREGSFKYSLLLDAPSYIIPIEEMEINPPTWEEAAWQPGIIEHRPVLDIKDITRDKISPVEKKHITAPFIAEVDLHIEQLIEKSQNMSNHEKLTLQLNYFLKCLDAAIAHKFKKITFIHGVGQGRLKDEILKIIAENYKGLRIQDGPFNKYGQGATEVLIPFNLTR